MRLFISRLYLSAPPPHQLNKFVMLYFQLEFCFLKVVQAADEGGKVSSATVNIKIIDINDETPEFKNTPYSFRLVRN